MPFKKCPVVIDNRFRKYGGYNDFKTIVITN